MALLPPYDIFLDLPSPVSNNSLASSSSSAFPMANDHSPIQVDDAALYDAPPPVQPRLQFVSPLAPLEYLQNQRRGSITDPSLHAHMHPPARDDAGSSPSHRPLDPSSSQSSPKQEWRRKSPPHVTTSATPYVFGDATVQPPTDKNLRRLLRSPSDSPDTSSHPDPGDPQRHHNNSFTRAMSGPPDDRTSGDPAARPTDDPDGQDPSRRKPDDNAHSQHPSEFDWSMRRHSIASGAIMQQTERALQEQQQRLGGADADRAELSNQNPRPILPRTLKRKMSADRMHYPGEDVDLNMAAHGIAGAQDDGPALKTRRGSAFDTQRIASLTLYDRRESLSAGPPSQQWWDRRDSSASMFSNVSSGGIPPPGNGAPHHEADAHMAGPPHRSFESPMSALNPPTSSMASFGHPAPSDRRMSVPDTMPPTAPTRRRPSRPSRSNSRTTTPAIKQPPSSAAQVTSATESDSASVESPAQTPASHTPQRDSALPYSRSPELRVSHKLAERKRRKEMKELFDELRDQLPADRGMKASKWEILSKAVDYIGFLKTNASESQREIEHLRHEVDQYRSGGHMPGVGQSPMGHNQGPPIPPPPNPFPGPKATDSVGMRGPPMGHYHPVNGSRRTPPV